MHGSCLIECMNERLKESLSFRESLTEHKRALESFREQGANSRRLGRTLKSFETISLLAWICPLLCIAWRENAAIFVGSQTVTSLPASDGASLAVCGQCYVSE